MLVLGINSVYHESSAALVEDGTIVAAAEEERFNRVKHAKPACVDNAHELPLAAIHYCLRAREARPRDVDAFAYSFSPAVRRRTFRVDPLSVPGDWGSEEGERRFQRSLESVVGSLASALGEDLGHRFVWVPHHLAHAASAFYPSGWNEAAVLVVDGIGEHATATFARGSREALTVLREVDYPHSLGFLWEKLSAYLGFSEYDACKVMGLAGYGDATTVWDAVGRFATIGRGGFVLDPDVLRFRLPDFAKLAAALGAARGHAEPLTARHAAIAAALQQFTDEAMLELARALHDDCPSDNLALAGGVGLNCTSNWRLKELGPFRNVYIPPAPHDAGTATGAALYTANAQAGPGGRTMPQHDPFLGPSFDDVAIREALAVAGLPAHRSLDVTAEAAALLADGRVVGWFQGRMEFGPRALGNRSLLADPRDPLARSRLNEKIKHREEFRPFAPTVLAEHADAWFELGRPSPSYAYMLFACPVRPAAKGRIPAVVHADGTARIQIVDAAANPKYHRLIHRFYEKTGVPVVLNTSFNDSEPIVCSPADAVATFRNTGIDALVLDDYIVQRGG